MSAARRPPLAILAGGGDFPVLVGRAAVASGREVLVIGIEGEASPEISVLPHVWLRRGQLGRLFRVLRGQGIDELVMIGGMRQRRLPRWSEIDAGGVFQVLRHLCLLARGDDSVLRRIARVIEANGVRVVGAAEIAPGLTVAAGCPTACAPTPADWQDIAAGFAAAKVLGAADKGQGAIACDGQILLREAADGTDAMLAELARLRQDGRLDYRRGVLVKCLKPNQDSRLDMPAIGPTTVAMADRAGLCGIAVEAGCTLVADRAEVVRELDRRGLFLVGVTTDDLPRMVDTRSVSAPSQMDRTP